MIDSDESTEDTFVCDFPDVITPAYSERADFDSYTIATLTISNKNAIVRWEDENSLTTPVKVKEVYSRVKNSCMFGLESNNANEFKLESIVL